MHPQRTISSPPQAPNSLVNWLRQRLSSQNPAVVRAPKRKGQGTLSQPVEWVLNPSLYTSPAAMSKPSLPPFDFVIRRHDVLAYATGSVVSRLMALTDSQENCMSAMQRLTLVFEGYHDDPREVHQIPEIKSFFRAVTDQWPYWMHFLQPDPDQVAVLILLLCDSDGLASDTMSVKGRITDAQQVWDCMSTMTRCTGLLHTSMGLRPSAMKAITKRFLPCIAKITV